MSCLVSLRSLCLLDHQKCARPRLTQRIKEFREVIATGNGQPNLNTTLISLVKTPFPPLPEQKAIANILSDMDTEIAALKKRRDKAHNIKQAMMQELLTGKTRLIKPEGN